MWFEKFLESEYQFRKMPPIYSINSLIIIGWYIYIYIYINRYFYLYSVYLLTLKTLFLEGHITEDEHSLWTHPNFAVYDSRSIVWFGSHHHSRNEQQNIYCIYCMFSNLYVEPKVKKPVGHFFKLWNIDDMSQAVTDISVSMSICFSWFNKAWICIKSFFYTFKVFRHINRVIMVFTHYSMYITLPYIMLHQSSHIKLKLNCIM